MPREILDEMNLKQYVLDSAGGLFQRFVASLWLRDKDSPTNDLGYPEAFPCLAIFSCNILNRHLVLA